MKCPECNSEIKLNNPIMAMPYFGLDEKGNLGIHVFVDCPVCGMVGELEADCELKWVWHDELEGIDRF